MAGCDVSEWRRDDGFLISTDPTRLDLPMIVDFLAQSYWAQGTPETLLRKSIDQALSFGLYASDDQQIGYARIVSDYSRFAWLSDVFVLDSHRGLGLGVWLVDTITEYPPLNAIGRFVLATRDAHGVYQKSGFEPLDQPEMWMLRRGD